MKCPECEKLGIKSTVRHNGGLTTLVSYFPYYDEDGEYHDHDPNRNTFFFECSEGHEFTTYSTHPCPNPKCDYGKK